eukprot:CFRG1895T1
MQSRLVTRVGVKWASDLQLRSCSCLVRPGPLRVHTSSYSVNPIKEEESDFGFTKVKTEEKYKHVREVFHNVADNYDVMNDLMSGGVHRLWKDYFVSKLGPTPETRVLDVAGGTGDIAFRIIDQIDHSQRSFQSISSSLPPVVVCDINTSMLRVGTQRAEARGYSHESLSWVAGNAEKLPFEDNSFDAYTIAFGIRNVTHIDAALREAHRVLKPGGRFLCLEFSTVANPVVSSIYDSFSFEVIPVIGHLVANDSASYQYLVESIRKFPDQETFSRQIKEAGFSNVSHENLTFGVAAIHSGFKL